ncbi:hypothetical protein HDU86_003844 [Geranomyces michiganensis]|nr:hypothetical protein HDU86_003844 [Geranomyces michiganensis]
MSPTVRMLSLRTPGPPAHRWTGTNEEATVAFLGEDGRFDLDRVYIGGDINSTFFKGHCIFDPTYFRKFGLGWELEQATQATSAGALLFVFFAARGLFALPWKEAQATGCFHFKANLVDLSVFPNRSKGELVGITPASTRSLGASFRPLVRRTRLDSKGITVKSDREGFARITRLRLRVALGTDNTGVNTSNMWTGIGPIVNTVDRPQQRHGHGIRRSGAAIRSRAHDGNMRQRRSVVDGGSKPGGPLQADGWTVYQRGGA